MCLFVCMCKCRGFDIYTFEDPRIDPSERAIHARTHTHTEAEPQPSETLKAVLRDSERAIFSQSAFVVPGTSPGLSQL